MRTTLPFALLLIVPVGSLLASSQLGEAIGQHAYAGASLLPSSSSSPNNKAVGRKLMLPVIHRDGPSYWRSSSEERRDHAQIMRLDNQRVTFIQYKLSSGDQTLSSRKATLPATSGARLGTGNYVVNISLGTPKKRLTLIFDTGSDLTWTQCQPCAVYCYNQDGPKFDPSQSSSYRNVSFESTACAQIASGTSEPPQSSGSTCYYGNKYADNSHTYGLFATEKLSLSPSPEDEINKFQFGCGQCNKGNFGRVAGMMGLGRDKISIVKQTVRKYGSRFSYCLPGNIRSTGYLSLGIDGDSPAVFTEMLTLTQAPSSYGIKLVAISINEKRLDIDPTVFSNAGTSIDSGTVITRLPKTAYKELRKAFGEAMPRDTMVPPPVGFKFDTCYDLMKISKATIPSVTFTFAKDVKVILKRNNIFYIIKEKNCACLAFMGNSDDTTLGLYGNQQQLKFEIIYDLPGGRIGFVPDKC